MTFCICEGLLASQSNRVLTESSGAVYFVEWDEFITFWAGCAETSPILPHFCVIIMSNLIEGLNFPPVSAHNAAYVELVWFVAPHLCARGDLIAISAGTLTRICLSL
jgi:hypothetical protein